MPGIWRHCSTCKKPIELGAKYLVCNVSTCNRKRTGLVFCSMDCWDAHLPGARHREAWAEERTAPKTPEDPDAPKKRAPTKPGRRHVVPTRRRDPSLPKDVLVVASKLKAYVKAAGELNTSDAVMEVLSEKLRDLCDAAIERAKADGRKTLLDRDFTR
jgi:hypothetical protein